MFEVVNLTDTALVAPKAASDGFWLTLPGLQRELGITD